MPQIWNIRYSWKDNQDPPQTQSLHIAASEEDALGELVSALQNDVIPTLGEAVTISASRGGTLRGTPGA